MANNVDAKEAGDVHPPPAPVGPHRVILDVLHDLLQEKRGSVEQHRRHGREGDLRADRDVIQPHELEEQLPARTDAAGPQVVRGEGKGKSRDWSAQRELHLLVGRGCAHVAGQDGEVADFEGLGGVSQHDYFRGVGEG